MTKKEQEWSLRLKEFSESGLSVTAWCKENHVCLKTYYRWRKRLTETVEFAEYVAEKENAAVARIRRGDLEIEILSEEVLGRLLGC